jgi:hypothetical protein
MITCINKFRKTRQVSESADGSVVEFTVRYEKQVEGEFDNFTQEFSENELDKALDFAKTYYSNVEFQKTLPDGKEQFGYVNPTTKQLVTYDKYKKF